MQTYIQHGKALDLTAPVGGVTSGLPVLIGSLLVVPVTDADAGELFAGETTGVFSVVKPGSQAWAEGEKVYWDDTAKKFTTVDTDNYACGVAVEAVGAGAGLTTGKVRLDGISLTVTPGA